MIDERAVRRIGSERLDGWIVATTNEDLTLTEMEVAVGPAAGFTWGWTRAASAIKVGTMLAISGSETIVWKEP